MEPRKHERKMKSRDFYKRIVIFQLIADDEKRIRIDPMIAKA